MILFQSFRAFASVLEAMLAAGLLIPKWWPLRFEIPASTKTFLQDRCVMVGLQEGGCGVVQFLHLSSLIVVA